MAKQIINGKGFEYSLLNALFETLIKIVKVDIIANVAYKNVEQCFKTLSIPDQGQHKNAAQFAIQYLLEIEPLLTHAINENDVIQLEIVSDEQGQHGDVRDVLIIRSQQKWEIGISAKNNHYAVKHSRLSNTIDFGQKWMELPCSDNYFEQIAPIFNRLTTIRKESQGTCLWSDLNDYHTTIYKPILDAFILELRRLNDANREIVPQKLIEYLIGNKDFYKVIKTDKGVEIQAYNLHGTLGLPYGEIKSKAHINKLKLPDRLIEITYKEGSQTTILVTLNGGWQVSFRIHNASSKVEASLKFDINLEGIPKNLFKTNSLILENKS